jgi:hypothetical protein
MTLGFDDITLFPPMSYGEIMDRLYSLWLNDGTNRTFDEFIG